jgi:hypothetical protein
MNAGRNDPCTCGSGKKYKHCCLKAANDADGEADDLVWRRLRRANEGLVAKQMRFLIEAYGDNAINEAWEEFLLWPEDEFESWSQNPDQQLFLPWLLHIWSPDPADTGVIDPRLHDVPPTRAFLQQRARQLEPLTQRYLEACLAAPLSFYEIVTVQPGQGFRARELIFGEECEVLERSGSQNLQKGDLLFGSLVAIDGIVMLEASAALMLPPKCKLQLLELRKTITARGDSYSPELLLEWEIELRGAYLAIADEIRHPQLPQFQNTDGEPLSLQKLIFDIDSPQLAFDALKHLALGHTDDELLADARRDASGALTKVDIAWLKAGNGKHKSWNSTVLGHIEIVGQRMTVNVNSNKRALRFRRIVTKTLGKHARYRATQLQSLERQMMESAAKGRGPPQPSAEEQALASNPAVQAALKKHLQEHYEDWPRQPLPALKGQSPLEAVRNPEGRERVEALIAQFEQDGTRMSPPLDAEIIKTLRARLGI